jgi:hypothetical protein
MEASGNRHDLPARACTVSVVVANYNHAKLLPRCLAAIEAQTRQPYEVLLIDDASIDDSLEVIERHASRLPRFQLIRHQTNTGVITSMNEGLRLASGSHVLFAAADDWIEPNLIAESQRWLERYPDAGLCSALTRLADDDGVITGPFRTPLPRRTAGYISPAHAVRQLARDDSWFNGSTTIVNRAAASAAGGYRPELASFCDGFLNARLAWSHGACFVPFFLAVWRRLETGYAATVNADPDALQRIFNAIAEIERAGVEPVPLEYLERWRGRWRFNVARAAIAPRGGRVREQLLSLLSPKLRFFVRLLVPFARVPNIGFPAATVFLFMVLRFRDIEPVLRRKLDWAVLGSRFETQS